ncbi:MAG: 30S ribosomal protein S12 methylthiotransferase RimO [Desulfovibrio sp.]|jgi:tRNA-2-methylthio-N6-dimethylallyladenosine synthase/ribosomal protein S12 methylthiotransferase|nr:30S ribosomal protein S12 methylthiotransferase RimO [Desulfovibrio sp.]
MIRIFSISLGCPKNRVDTERTLGTLGLVRIVPRIEDADCVFINTCGFIAPAVRESVRVVMDSIDRVGRLPKRKRPLLAVAGCLVGRYGHKTLAPELPEVDLLLDNRELALWPEKLSAALGLTGAVPGIFPRLLSTGPAYGWLKISDGCRHACSFCTIPSIRGPLCSIPAERLLGEARFLLEQGVKELILVAQDLTVWGRDLGMKHGLKILLERLLPLSGLVRLRLMYLYPAGLSPDLLRFLQAAGSPFVPYFDVPLQHAAPKVLSRMGRPFARSPRALVERIRSFFPLAALRTSIIVGFPGEKEKDFTRVCDFIGQVRFHHLGVFAYQPEEGTPAAAMPDQVPDREKQWRRDSLMNMQGEISEAILAAYVGQRLDVLVDKAHGEWPGLHVGRAWFQAPESDGITYVSGPGVFPGALVDADITEASTYDLVGLTDADG